jgi:hypothetical protein
MYHLDNPGDAARLNAFKGRLVLFFGHIWSFGNEGNHRRSSTATWLLTWLANSSILPASWKDELYCDSFVLVRCCPKRSPMSLNDRATD